MELLNWCTAKCTFRSHFIVLAEVVSNKVTQDLSRFFRHLYFSCEHFFLFTTTFNFYLLHFLRKYFLLLLLTVQGGSSYS